MLKWLSLSPIRQWVSSKTNHYREDRLGLVNDLTSALQEKHKTIQEYVGGMVGEKSRIESDMDRSARDIEDLVLSIRARASLSENLRQNGDIAGAETMDSEAQELSVSLVLAEERLDELKELHRQQLTLINKARESLLSGGVLLTRTISQRTEVLRGRDSDSDTGRNDG